MTHHSAAVATIMAMPVFIAMPVIIGVATAAFLRANRKEATFIWLCGTAFAVVVFLVVIFSGYTQVLIDWANGTA